MKVLLAGFLAMLTLSANAEDMQKYLADTQEMVRQGKHQEALDRFIWFHEHALENDRGMTGVRPFLLEGRYCLNSVLLASSQNRRPD